VSYLDLSGIPSHGELWTNQYRKVCADDIATLMLGFGGGALA
jgi:hypothetical protein